MQILDGKEVSKSLRSQMKAQSEALVEKLGRSPGLAVVLVGEDPASQVYVRNKIKACSEVGIESFHHELPDDIKSDELKKLILSLNEDPKVDGILVQLPLPGHLDTIKVLSWINPSKDPDGLTDANMGKLFASRPLVASCTPAGVMEILKYYKIPIKGKTAVVVGRSNIVGKPMGHLLLMEDATVGFVHKNTKDPQKYTTKADILIVAAGVKGLIGADDIKEGAVIIDVGIHRTDKGLCGDVRWDEIQDKASAATPVPGGVGPMTITMLLANTLKLAGQPA